MVVTRRGRRSPLGVGVRTDIGRRLLVVVAALGSVIAIGTLGFVAFGRPPLDALYYTVFTVTTVGFEEIAFTPAEKVFAILLILGGVGSVLYTLTLLFEALVEGHVGSLMGRRRMEREVGGLAGHAIVCGYGRVGRAAAHELDKAGRDVVVIDYDAERVESAPYPTIVGDATSDQVLRRAGVERAGVLVATLENDAASLYVTLSARALSSDLVIIARSRTDDAEKKFTRAGANRVINPQRIGGDRIAAFAMQPHVVDFLDVAMKDAGMEFRLEDIEVRPGSRLSGATVREAREHDGGDALVLALREPSGVFVTNPPADRAIGSGDVLIAIGTAGQLAALRKAAET